MNQEQRQSLLGHIRDGYDVEAAAATLGLTMAQIGAAGPGLKAEIEEAYRTATARLRAKVTSLALKGEDAGMLARILDKRDEAQARMAAPEVDDPGDWETARRLAFVIARGLAAEDIPVLVQRIVEHAEGQEGAQT